MLRGRIIRVTIHRNFGFLRPADGGENLFFHRGELSDRLEWDSDLLQREVTYEAGAGRDGRPCAVNVQPAW